jgi:hypothetical protein
MGKGSKPASDHQKAANKATARVRANNAVPDGAQIDHSIKVRGAKEAGMPMDRMNKSLIPLHLQGPLGREPRRRGGAAKV